MNAAPAREICHPIVRWSRAKRVAVWVLAWGWAAAFAAADGTPEDLVVHVGGFTHDRGQAIANLFRAGDDVFGKPFARVVAKLAQGKATLIFPGLQPGDYAVTVFHDENGNDDLDHNFLRFPVEPLGFSNGFKLGLFAGLPNFEKLRFNWDAGSQPLAITVQ